MALIPPFNSDGLLPPGDYEVTFDQLRKSPLVMGTISRTFSSNWDAQWRHHLVSNLEILTRQLWHIGISDVFADGSFAEAKDHPNELEFPSAFRQSRSNGAPRGIIKLRKDSSHDSN
jgi:hypothetical protein